MQTVTNGHHPESPPMSAARLAGVRVLVTRPRERAEELCFLLEDEGAEVVALPFLELLPPDDERPLRSAAEGIHRYEWVVLASSAAAHAIAEATREAGTLDRLTQVKVAVVGPATARTAQSLGMQVTLQAQQSTGAALAAELIPQLGTETEVLLPAAQEGRHELPDALLEAGARLTRVAAYRSAGKLIEPAALEALRAAPPAVVMFASPRTVEAFAESEARALIATAKLVAIGPTTAAAIEELGMGKAQVAARPTAAELVEAAVVAITTK
jgi:uroporphyrinogen-III synthase